MNRSMYFFYEAAHSIISPSRAQGIVGLRPTPDQEREGLDITDHGERAYNY